jgi:hypothetical protein
MVCSSLKFSEIDTNVSPTALALTLSQKERDGAREKVGEGGT